MKSFGAPSVKHVLPALLALCSGCGFFAPVDPLIEDTFLDAQEGGSPADRAEPIEMKNEKPPADGSIDDESTSSIHDDEHEASGDGSSMDGFDALASRDDSDAPAARDASDANVDRDAFHDGGTLDASDVLDARSDRPTRDVSPEIIPPPRLIRPLSKSVVTSQQPTFRWALAAGVDGASVQLCRDPSCASIVTSLEIDGTSARPADPLAKGVYYWRAFGRIGNSRGTKATPVWNFTVGARSAPTDLAWGTLGGPAVIVAAATTKSVTMTDKIFLYDGSPGSFPTVPTRILPNNRTPAGAYGYSVGCAGDVDGDGKTDFIVGWPEIDAREGRALVYTSDTSGALVESSDIGAPRIGYTRFGGSVAGVGDVNGDGYGDIVIGTIIYYPENRGRVSLFLGNPSAPFFVPAVTLTAPIGLALREFGISYTAVAGAGDVNGDGYADVVVGMAATNDFGDGAASQPGRAFVYLGSPSGMLPDPTVQLGGADSPGGAFGRSVGTAGDVNGDGYTDVIVGDPFGSLGGRAYVYMGGPAAGFFGISETPATTLSDGNEPWFGVSVSTAGDVNGDGYSDVVVGSNEKVFIYLGGPSGLSTVAANILTCVDHPQADAGLPGFGRTVVGIGDMNGDGFDDIVIGAPSFDETGRAYVYRGAASGVLATPSAKLLVVDPNSGVFHFGAALAGLNDAQPRFRSWKWNGLSCGFKGSRG